MRALILKKHGSPEDALGVEERPSPTPGAGQIRINVKASGINFADLLARVGLYPDAPKPPTIMGYEIAGEVDELGGGTNGFKPGQRVLAATRFTGFAEQAVADARNVLALPDGMSFEQGAAIPVNYGTAYAAAVLMAAVREGETVLVSAAAGGVGVAALQILRTRGATVIATASGSKHELCREQGAQHAIDYRKQNVRDEVMRLTDGEGVDVVLDGVGDFRTSYKLLRPGGRLVLYGVSNILSGDRRSGIKVAKEIAKMPWFNPIKLMNQNKAVMGLNLLHWWDKRGSLEEFIKPLVEMMERGEVDPVVGESFPLDRAADAHRYMQERKSVGKVVLTL
jgi:NADPH:quinone reductase-like Zn-dependent oxidoreductase